MKGHIDRQPNDRQIDNKKHKHLENQNTDEHWLNGHMIDRLTNCEKDREKHKRQTDRQTLDKQPNGLLDRKTDF